MKIERTWRASSKIDKYKKSDDLVNLAGHWNVGIKVSITMPYTYSQGPVEKSVSRKKTYEQEIPPSSDKE